MEESTNILRLFYQMEWGLTFALKTLLIVCKYSFGKRNENEKGTINNAY